MIHVLSGVNTFARTQKVQAFVTQFTTEYGAEHVERYRGEDLSVEDLPNLFQGASLFSANRLVIIRGIESNREVSQKLVEYLEKATEETEILFVEDQLDKRTSFYKELKKKTDFHEFPELSEQEVMKWVPAYVGERGGTIQPPVTKLIIDYIGTDQQRLASELEKLISYEATITRETVEMLVEPRAQSTVFELLDQALSGQQDNARATLKRLEAAFEDPFQIANLLMWQVQVLAVVKSAGARSDSEIAKEAKLNPYVVSKTKRIARNIDQKKLNTIVGHAAELDQKLKTISGQPWSLIEAAIISFAQ